MKATDRVKPVGENLLMIDDRHPLRSGVRIDRKVLENPYLPWHVKGVYVHLAWMYLETEGKSVLIQDLQNRTEQDEHTLPALRHLAKFSLVKVVKK